MAPSAADKVGYGLAKVLGIKLQYRNPTGQPDITTGESVFSSSTADTFVEHEPTTGEWFREVLPTGRTFINWAHNLFPFTHWIDRYNVQWLIGDLVAGQSRLSLRLVGLSIDHLMHRYHGGMCCRSPVDGLCQIGFAPRTVWSIFLLHGRLDILVLRHLQGHHYWRQ